MSNNFQINFAYIPECTFLLTLMVAITPKTSDNFQIIRKKLYYSITHHKYLEIYSVHNVDCIWNRFSLGSMNLDWEFAFPWPSEPDPTRKEQDPNVYGWRKRFQYELCPRSFCASPEWICAKECADYHPISAGPILRNKHKRVKSLYCRPKHWFCAFSTEENTSTAEKGEPGISRRKVITCIVIAWTTPCDELVNDEDENDIMSWFVQVHGIICINNMLVEEILNVHAALHEFRSYNNSYYIDLWSSL